jgi:hypothetical protein
MKTLLTFMFFVIFTNWVFSQDVPAPVFNLYGGALSQDSLDNKLQKKDSSKTGGYMTYTLGKDSLAVKVNRKDTVGVNAGTYATTARMRDSLAAVRAGVVAKVDTTTENPGSYATRTQLKDSTTVKLNRSELALVYGTAQIILRDSIQVSVTSLTTASGLAIVCYRAPDNNIASADTVASFRINTAGKLTIVGKNGAWYDYWIIRK